MTSSSGNIFSVTGSLCGEFAGHRWISPHKGQWHGALMFSLICVWINGWVNNREAGNLRRYRAIYDVTVMVAFIYGCGRSHTSTTRTARLKKHAHISRFVGNVHTYPQQNKPWYSRVHISWDILCDQFQNWMFFNPSMLIFFGRNINIYW